MLCVLEFTCFKNSGLFDKMSLGIADKPTEKVYLSLIYFDMTGELKENFFIIPASYFKTKIRLTLKILILVVLSVDVLYYHLVILK